MSKNNRLWWNYTAANIRWHGTYVDGRVPWFVLSVPQSLAYSECVHECLSMGKSDGTDTRCSWERQTTDATHQKQPYTITRGQKVHQNFVNKSVQAGLQKRSRQPQDCMHHLPSLIQTIDQGCFRKPPVMTWLLFSHCSSLDVWIKIPFDCHCPYQCLVRHTQVRRLSSQRCVIHLGSKGHYSIENIDHCCVEKKIEV